MERYDLNSLKEVFGDWNPTLSDTNMLRLHEKTLDMQAVDFSLSMVFVNVR